MHRLGARSVVVLGLLLSCRSKSERELSPPQSLSPTPAPTLLVAPSATPLARPESSEVLAFEKQLQASKLRPPPRRAHEAHLAFGKGVFAQLGAEELRIFDIQGGAPRLLVSEPVEAPRALLALADGGLLAVDASRLLHWDPSWKRAKPLPRPVLLPGSELFADALRSDLIWRLEPASGAAPATLSSFRLAPSDTSVLLPEQTLELTTGRDAVLGLTREGVWLWLSPGRGARFAPNGLRLPGLELGASPLPTWSLPALRLDQSVWVEEGGRITRVQVSPTFKALEQVTLAGTAFAADVGDQGRLVAVSTITGDGPRFELELFDAALKPSARVVLPAEAPTGKDDWVDVVTRNQELVVSPRAPRVAVGGPERATIFDAQGRVIFSIPSK